MIIGSRKRANRPQSAFTIRLYTCMGGKGLKLTATYTSSKTTRKCGSQLVSRTVTRWVGTDTAWWVTKRNCTFSEGRSTGMGV